MTESQKAWANIKLYLRTCTIRGEHAEQFVRDVQTINTLVEGEQAKRDEPPPG